MSLSRDLPQLCPDCGGSRLRLEARLVRVGDKTLPEVCAMSAADAAEFFDHLTLSPSETEIANRLLHEVPMELRWPPRTAAGITAAYAAIVYQVGVGLTFPVSFKTTPRSMHGTTARAA